MMRTKSYPQTPRDWQSALQKEIGISKSEGQKALHEGKFPYQQLTQWIRETFSDGYSPDFVPALLRNIHGLVSWVYGDSEEPSWPGSDDQAMSG